MSISYKSKYTALLTQHLQVIGHLNEALSGLSAANTEITRLDIENEKLDQQIHKLQAAAVKSIEAKLSQKESPKPTK